MFCCRTCTFWFPFEDLQIENEDRVEHRDQEQCDEGGHGQPADLRVTQRLPERASMQRQGEQGEDGGPDRDHHRAQAHDAGINHRFFKRLALGMLLLDEIEKSHG